MSTRELFADSYIEYLLSLDHVVQISKMDNYFFQLILFLHKDSDVHNNIQFAHKISLNCFYVNKNFQNNIVFSNNGKESTLFIKYIIDHCPTEISKEFNSSNILTTFYKCDFQCQLTFQIISEKLRLYAEKNNLTKNEITKKIKELKELKNENLISQNKFDNLNDEITNDLIKIKNICTFRKFIKNSVKYNKN